LKEKIKNYFLEKASYSLSVQLLLLLMVVFQATAVVDVLKKI
jgi:hypothetical protein